MLILTVENSNPNRRENYFLFILFDIQQIQNSILGTTTPFKQNFNFWQVLGKVLGRFGGGFGKLLGGFLEDLGGLGTFSGKLSGGCWKDKLAKFVFRGGVHVTSQNDL